MLLRSRISRDAAKRPDRARPRLSVCTAGLITIVLLAAGAAPAADRAMENYDPMEAGNPLRIIAYVVHPVGVTLDYLIMRPAYWVGSHEPFHSLFGRQD